MLPQRIQVESARRGRLPGLLPILRSAYNPPQWAIVNSMADQRTCDGPAVFGVETSRSCHQRRLRNNLRAVKTDRRRVGCSHPSERFPDHTPPQRGKLPSCLYSCVKTQVTAARWCVESRKEQDELGDLSFPAFRLFAIAFPVNRLPDHLGHFHCHHHYNSQRPQRRCVTSLFMQTSKHQAGK